MSIAIKPGVRVRGMSSEILLGILIAQNVYSESNDALTITSITDGRHGIGSLHHVGDAVDLRLPVNTTPVTMGIRLRAALGPSYDVVVESDHIHMEYDPK